MRTHCEKQFPSNCSGEIHRSPADFPWLGNGKPYSCVWKIHPMTPSPYRFTGESPLPTVTGRRNQRLRPPFPRNPLYPALRTAL